MKINGLILRATPNRGRMWTLEIFTEQLGRAVLSAVAEPSTGFSPFCLIEAEAEEKTGLLYSRTVEVLDTFTRVRSQPQASKAALILRAILEQCLPMRAPAEGLWKLLLALLETLPSFCDWKAAPLLLALMMFEHEGIAPLSLTENSALAEEDRKTMQHLLESDEKVWRETVVPEELLKAALETINVKNM